MRWWDTLLASAQGSSKTRTLHINIERTHGIQTPTINAKLLKFAIQWGAITLKSNRPAVGWPCWPYRQLHVLFTTNGNTVAIVRWPLWNTTPAKGQQYHAQNAFNASHRGRDNTEHRCQHNQRQPHQHVWEHPHPQAAATNNRPANMATWAAKKSFASHYRTCVNKTVRNGFNYIFSDWLFAHKPEPPTRRVCAMIFVYTFEYVRCEMPLGGGPSSYTCTISFYFHVFSLLLLMFGPKIVMAQLITNKFGWYMVSAQATRLLGAHFHIVIFIGFGIGVKLGLSAPVPRA